MSTHDRVSHGLKMRKSPWKRSPYIQVSDVLCYKPIPIICEIMFALFVDISSVLFHLKFIVFIFFYILCSVHIFNENILWCVSASDKPDLGLEELTSLNVKSRYQVFEKTDSQGGEVERSPSSVSVKRSPSILSKLAKWVFLLMAI